MKASGFQLSASMYFAALLMVLFLYPLAGSAREGCDASGEYSFVCGPINAEDLVRVPDSHWIISSGMAPDSAIYLLNSQDKSWTELYPSDAPGPQQNMEKFSACPGAPNPNNFVSHGMSIQPGTDGLSTLYVVGHGGREAVEVFDVDASGPVPELTWTGCILTPEGLEANSVASLDDGSLLITIPLHHGLTISDALAGHITGSVYAWSPGDPGFTMVRGTEQPYVNGIEVSDDGREFYTVSSGLFTLSAYSNSNPAQLLRSTEVFPIAPDNLHMAEDGTLITAGMNLIDPVCGDVQQSAEFDLAAFASCPRPFTVLAIDPDTMKVDVMETGPANKQFSNVTMALPVEGTLWIGTFGGDRIAYRTLKKTE